jgi:spermidine/putrescine transport system permease protein
MASAPVRANAGKARWHGRFVLILLLAPAVLWLGALIILPHVDLAILSFRERVGPRQYVASLAEYKIFFTEPLYWHVFVRTAVMSVVATFLTLLLAFPMAWIIAKIAQGRARSTLFILCLIPFWVSETVRTLGWMILLRESGVLPSLLVKLGVTSVPVELLYHDATIMVGLIYASLLFMVIPLISSLESLDNALIEAAYNLGANGLAVLRTIVARTRSGSPSRSIPSSSPASTGSRVPPSAFCSSPCRPPWS